MTIFDMSVAGGVVILAVIVIRALGVNRLPKAMFTALWAVALLRLLAPVSVPSAVSVYGWFGPSPAAEIMERAPVGDLSPAAARSDGATADRASAAARPVAQAEKPAPVEQVFRIPWKTVIWAAGALGCGGFFAASYIRCRRKFREAVPAEDGFVRRWQEARPTGRKISVRLSGRVDAPMTYGLIRPVILLPAGLDWRDEGRLDMILRHEYAHIRRWDGARKLVLTGAVCLHWFNPLVWAMYILANRDMEMACDQQVVRSLAGDGRAGYARALIDMAEVRSGLTPLVSHFSKSAMEERITAIMKMKKRVTAFTAAVSVLLTLGVTAVFATSAPEETLADTPVPYDWGEAAVLFPIGAEGEKNFADLSIQWWEPEDFARWVEEQKPLLEAAVGSEPDTGTVAADQVWTEERSERVLAAYEDIAAALEAGTGKLSKTVGGGSEVVIAEGMDWPLDTGSERTVRGYDVEALLWGGQEDWPEGVPAQTYSVELVPGERWADFGPSQTSAGLFRTIRAYFQCMAQAGAMDRDRANEILETWWAQNQGSDFPDSYVIHTRQETDPDAPYGPLEEEQPLDWLDWLGEDPLSFKVFYNGVPYQLPAPVKDFAANGWSVTEGAGEMVAPGESCPAALTLSGTGEDKGADWTLETRVRNYSDVPLPVEDCYVTFVGGGAGTAGVSIVVPAPGIGIACDMPGKELTQALRGMDYTLDEDGDDCWYTMANEDGSVVIRTAGEDIRVTGIQVTCEPEAVAVPAEPAVTPTPEPLDTSALTPRYVWDLTGGSGMVREEDPDGDYLLDIQPYGYRAPVNSQFVSGCQSASTTLQPGEEVTVGSAPGPYETLVIFHDEGQVSTGCRRLADGTENPAGGHVVDVKDGDVQTGSNYWAPEGGSAFYVRNAGDTPVSVDAFLYETE